MVLACSELPHTGDRSTERILKENPVGPPDPTNDDAGKQCKIVSKYPGHTWNADLTVVPISAEIRSRRQAR